MEYNYRSDYENNFGNIKYVGDCMSTGTGIYSEIGIYPTMFIIVV